MLGFRQSHAVVIGIDAYQSGIPPLRTAVNDARRVAEVLQADLEYSVQLLTEAVTRVRLRALFEETLPKQVEADDRLLVYFAGHGIALDGDDGPAGYLVPQDARRDDRGSFLPMTELAEWLDRLPSRHLLLVLDCCFAGAFRWSSTRDLGGLPEVIHKERFDRYVRDPAWQVITSAAHDQKALDVLSGETIGVRDAGVSCRDHSPFAAAFLRALQGEADLVPRSTGARPGGDGVITATELYLYLRDCVEAGAEGVGHRQTPGFWPLRKHDKGEFIHLVPGHELNLPPAPPLDEMANPWRGLRSYDETDAPLFFGRTRFVADLADRVPSRPLTIVLGASGTGKSSVVKAGLLPLLRSRDPDAWQVLPPLRPGRSPLAALAALALPGEPTDPDAIVGRLDAAGADPEALARRVSAWAAATPPGASTPRRLLLVVDQFEELLTLCWDDTERERLQLQLHRALAACPDRLRVVLTLRSDFEPQFAHSPLEAEWLAARIVVPAMTLDEYREAIEGPASVRVLYFRGETGSQAFINRLIGDVANTPGALPLLSFTLSELYRRYLARGSGDRSLSEEDYEALGGVGGSLRNRADEVHAGLPDDAHRETMRRVMLRMVSVEGGELARRRVLDGELVYDGDAENGRVREVLRRLTEARLVVDGKDEDDRTFVEPAHDELIRGWDRLLRWVREGQESLQLRQVLSPAVRDWGRDARPNPGKLWHANPRLSLLRRILHAPDNWLNEAESRFIRRSVARRWAILRTTIASISVAMVSLSALTIVAWISRNQAVERAEIAQSRELATFSLLETDQHLDRSLLLATEALRAHGTFEARSQLVRAVVNRPGLLTIVRGMEGYVRSLAFSRDGRILAVGLSRDHQSSGMPERGGFVVLWDTRSWRRMPGGTLAVEEGPVKSVAFGPGNSLAAGFEDLPGRESGVVVWDGKGRRRLDVTEGDVNCVTYGADGILAAGCSTKYDVHSGGVVIWTATGRQFRRVEGGPVEGIVVGRDGSVAAYSQPNYGAGRLTMWDAAGQLVAEIPSNHELKRLEKLDLRENMPLSPRGNLLYASDEDGRYAIKDAAKGFTIWRPSPTGTGSGFCFSPDEGLLARGVSALRPYGFDPYTNGVEVWETEQRLFSERSLKFRRAATAISEAAISDDGSITAVGYHNVGRRARGGGVHIWDASGQSEWPVDEGAVTSVDVSPDGRTVLAGFEPHSADGEAGGVVVRDGSGWRTLKVAEGRVFDVDISRDGRMVAAFEGADRGGAVIWDDEGRHRLDVPEGPLNCLSFDPSGKALVAGFGAKEPGKPGGLVVWDAEGRQRLDVPEGSVTSLAFDSPDGQQFQSFVVGIRGVVNGILIWDTKGGRRRVFHPVPTPESPFGPAVRAFDPEGKTVALEIGVGLVLLDAATGRRLNETPLDVPWGSIVSITPRADGRTLAIAYSGSGRPVNGGGVVFWDCMTEDSWVKLARRIANRNLTHDEWKEYFGPEVPYRRTFADLPDGTGVVASKTRSEAR